MASTTKAEAECFSERHANTARQIREHMKTLEPGTQAFLYEEREAVDHETRAKEWLEYAAKQ